MDEAILIGTAKAAVRKYGSYEAARVELAKQRDNSAWGTFSHNFWNQACRALEAAHDREEL